MKNIKTNWDLKLLYKSPKDPQIEKDIRRAERVCDEFAKKYSKSKTHLRNENALLKALKDCEKLIEDSSGSRAVFYFHYLKDLDASDQRAESMINKLHNRLTKAGNKILFFNLELGKIDKKLQKKFLKSKKLAKYRHHLSVLFERAKHRLSEPEEKILNLKSLPGYLMWVNGVEKNINKKTVDFEGKKISFAEAGGKIAYLPTQKRRELFKNMMLKTKEAVEFSESEINAIFTDKKIDDDLRGFEKPYSAAVLEYENDEKTVLNLVKNVENNFDISHKFGEIKSKILGLKFLEYADKYAVIGKLKRKFDFAESVDILREGFGGVGKRYLNIFNSMLKNGQIDAFPKIGKADGAYCSSSVKLPTFVLLNHTNDFRSLTTLAHEMGHAIHAELSKKQPAIYQDYSISVAETASTFFEQLIFDKIMEKLTDKEKVIALHDKINNSVGTIFRQVACFNFELELHEKVRHDGFVPAEEIAKIMNKHMKSYLGSTVKLTELDGYIFIRWSHIRQPFYVYTYALGELVSRALYARYKKDKNYVKNIEGILEAGGSKSPKDILKDAGININSAEFLKDGFENLRKELAEFAGLIKKTNYKI